MKFPIQCYLEGLIEELAHIDDGEVADYIPELGKVDPNHFGICLVTMDGTLYSTGSTGQLFTIQSISKAFAYASALSDRGTQFMSARVGVEPSGDAFNSISLNPQTGAPLNPMINAGAIATSSLVAGEDTEAQWDRIISSLSTFAGRELGVDEAVYRSESDTGFRNRAIAWMLKNFAIIDNDPMASLENYFRQCSVLVNCRDLAYMAATLANGGVHPLTRKRAMPSEYVEQVLSVMATCGMYDYAGSWLYEVGMPAKSGVGGGIVAVLPGRFGIGVFSPRLDAKGNSVRGIEVCRRLSRDFGLHSFAPHATDPSSALGRVYTSADAPSRRQPPRDAHKLLRDNAHRIKYFSLHGYLAVENIEYISRRMEALAEESDYYILDMHQVSGISESGARLLNQARQGFAKEGVSVIFSRIHNSKAIKGPLKRTLPSGDNGILTFEDNDVAVEWCENNYLDQSISDLPSSDEQLSDAIIFKGISESMLVKLQSIVRSKGFACGDVILESGEVDDGQIFFIRSGRVSVLVPTNSQEFQRISTFGAGMVFGEMVLLGQTTRSASVYADTEVECWIIDKPQLDEICISEPQLKILMLENLANEMAGKLRDATQWISVLA